MRNISPFLIGLLCLGMLSCSEEAVVQTEEAIKPVKYGEVIQTAGLQNLTFNGLSKSASETQLSFRANGLIVYFPAKVGQRVQKGMLLGKLDQKDVLLSYEKAKADVQNAQVQLETMASNLERVKKLYQTNNASLNDYEQAKSSYSSAESSFEIAQRSRDLQKSQIEYTVINSPMTGVISEVHASVNEFAQAGNPVLVMSSAKEDDIEVEVGMPERYISQVKQGAQVEIKFPSLGQELYKGTLTEVGYSSSEGATFPVTATLVAPTEAMRPGMPAEVSFTFGEATENTQLVAPIKAVGEDPGGNFVYVLEQAEEHYVARKQAIEIGPLISEGFIVKTGLSDGDLVAIAGLRTLFDGRKVRLLP